MNKLMTLAKVRAQKIQMRRYYRQTFGSDAGRIVLRDLVGFCGANADLFHPNERQEAYALGKRRVLLRIQAYLNMTLEDIEGLNRPDPEDDEEIA